MPALRSLGFCGCGDTVYTAKETFFLKNFLSSLSQFGLNLFIPRSHSRLPICPFIHSFVSLFVKTLIYFILTALGLHCCVHASSSCRGQGLLPSRGLQASHWGDLSCCRAWAPEPHSFIYSTNYSVPCLCEPLGEAMCYFLLPSCMFKWTVISVWGYHKSLQIDPWSLVCPCLTLSPFFSQADHSKLWLWKCLCVLEVFTYSLMHTFCTHTDILGCNHTECCAFPWMCLAFSYVDFVFCLKNTSKPYSRKLTPVDHFALNEEISSPEKLSLITQAMFW